MQRVLTKRKIRVPQNCETPSFRNITLAVLIRNVTIIKHRRRTDLQLDAHVNEFRLNLLLKCNGLYKNKKLFLNGTRTK